MWQWGTPLKKAKISHEVENVFFSFFQLYLYNHSNEKGSNKNERNKERNEESETIKIKQDWSRVAIRTVQGAWFCWKCMNGLGKNRSNIEITYLLKTIPTVCFAHLVNNPLIKFINIFSWWCGPVASVEIISSFHLAWACPLWSWCVP